jgi:redox-sensitive bicupin YhaK (pirin superfamily)
MFFFGKTFGEALAWVGPIVLNTEQELAVAFEELKQGTFIKERR